MVQMSANPNYQGFLQFSNRWSGALFVKHGLYLVVLVLSAALTWGVHPALRRAGLRHLLGEG
jgi:hypothetical protein